MKTVIGFLLLFGIHAAGLADNQAVTFYTQLIRGSDQDKPAKSNWRAVGPKLSKQLAPKFRWKNYWEVSRQSVDVLPGKSARLGLNGDREIEIAFRGAEETEIRLFNGGKLVRKSRQALECKMIIMGGGSEERESWFIVIRREKPTVD